MSTEPHLITTATDFVEALPATLAGLRVFYLDGQVVTVSPSGAMACTCGRYRVNAALYAANDADACPHCRAVTTQLVTEAHGM